ncbi:MAG: PAAR domain-containing protein [Bacteroidota bacterium]
MSPAARLLDMRECSMGTSGVLPVPHVGSPVFGPDCLTILIGGMPAARLGDMLVCVGPPDSIGNGSQYRRCISRMRDSTAYGGTIVMGAPTVNIDGSSKPIS